MNKFTLIIPCYNEQKNINEITNKIIFLSKRVKFDAILVDNGSTDKTREELIKARKNKDIPNLQIIFIDSNIGFGNAIKKGIKESKNNLICYTHADLQTDLNDVLTAYEIFLKNGAQNLFIKGFRFKRNFLDSIFTYAMTFLISIMFVSKLIDIHAQPNFFDRKIINNLDFVPDDFSIDIYLLLAAKKANQKLIRFNVLFNKRLHGIGNNEGFISKILHATKIILSSLRIVFSRKF